jgi:hypothetical protein
VNSLQLKGEADSQKWRQNFKTQFYMKLFIKTQIILLTMFLLPISLVAQITFTETEEEVTLENFKSSKRYKEVEAKIAEYEQNCIQQHGKLKSELDEFCRDILNSINQTLPENLPKKVYFNKEKYHAPGNTILFISEEQGVDIKQKSVVIPVGEYQIIEKNSGGRQENLTCQNSYNSGFWIKSKENGIEYGVCTDWHYDIHDRRKSQIKEYREDIENLERQSWLKSMSETSVNIFGSKLSESKYLSNIRNIYEKYPELIEKSKYDKMNDMEAEYNNFQCVPNPYLGEKEELDKEYMELILKNAGWNYMIDIIMEPYDSTYLSIQYYPILEAYKKYIGQQVFYLDGSHFNEKHIMYKSNRDFQPKDMVHQYYEIVDIISFTSAIERKLREWEKDFQKDEPRIRSQGYDVKSYFKNELERLEGIARFDDRYVREFNITKQYVFPCEERPNHHCFYSIQKEDIPCFVLKNIQSMDTIHCYISPTAWSSDRGLILVGGFLKLKRKIGENIIAFKDTYFGLDVLTSWKIIDVSIAKGNYIKNERPSSDLIENRETFVNLKYSEEIERVSFVLQNNDNPNIKKNLPVSEISAQIITDNNRRNWFMVFEKDYKYYKLAKNKEKQQSAQEDAKRKQQLTAKYGAANAEKILAGKFEIGMSKNVCREIASNLLSSVVAKTETTETWKVDYFFGVMYLYFTGDKLTKIVNR